MSAAADVLLSGSLWGGAAFVVGGAALARLSYKVTEQSKRLRVVESGLDTIYLTDEDRKDLGLPSIREEIQARTAGVVDEAVKDVLPKLLRERVESAVPALGKPPRPQDSVACREHSWSASYPGLVRLHTNKQFSEKVPEERSRRRCVACGTEQARVERYVRGRFTGVWTDD